MNGFLKNFRGIFSQSSLNNLAVVVEAAAAEAQSGDLHLAPRAQNFLTVAGSLLGVLHVIVNAEPGLVVPDAAPHPLAPAPGSLDKLVAANQAAEPAPAPVAETSAAPAPAPVAETSAAPAPAPAPAPVDTSAALAGLFNAG